MANGFEGNAIMHEIVSNLAERKGLDPSVAMGNAVRLLSVFEEASAQDEDVIVNTGGEYSFAAPRGMSDELADDWKKHTAGPQGD